MTQRRYESELFAQLEAILLISDEPVTIQQLVKVTEASPTELETTLEAIQRDYDGKTDGPVRGFQLRHVAGGWRLYTRADHADVVATYMVQGATQKLSQAAL